MKGASALLLTRNLASATWIWEDEKFWWAFFSQGETQSLDYLLRVGAAPWPYLADWNILLEGGGEEEENGS